MGRAGAATLLNGPQRLADLPTYWMLVATRHAKLLRDYDSDWHAEPVSEIEMPCP